MGNSDRFKLDPNIVKMAGDGKALNYGHAISKMFKDLGDIEEKEAEQETKELENKTKKLQYQSVADTVADKKVVSEYIASDSADLSTWLEDNKKTLKTPEWQLKAKELSDSRMDTVWDESLNAHESYLKENNLFLTDDGHVNMDEVRMQLAKDPQNLHLAQAFERKYGVKLDTPSEQSTKEKLEKEHLQAKINKINNEINNPKSNESNSEFITIMSKLKNNKELTDEEESLYKARLEKLSQPDLASMKIKMNAADEKKADFAKTLGVKNVNDLILQDPTKWTPQQRVQAQETAMALIKGYGFDEKETIKAIKNYGAIGQQVDVVLDGLEKGDDFRALDEGVRKYFSNYFGLSEDEKIDAQTVNALQSIHNIKIKADSGAAVSAHELVRQVAETSTNFMTKDKILIGVKTVANRQLGEMRGLKSAMGELPFHLKYGHIEQTYKDIVSEVDNQLQNENSNKNEIINPIYDPSKKETTQQTEQITQPTVLKVSDFEKHGIKVGY
jgi:hypothetical protein